MNSDFICWYVESYNLCFLTVLANTHKGLAQKLENGLLKPLVLHVHDIHHDAGANVFVFGLHLSLPRNHKSRWD